MSKLIKTVKLRIKTTPGQSQAFRCLTKQYKLACNHVSKYIFGHGFELNTNKLNKVLYTEVRTAFSLKSQLTQSVFRTVVAKYKTVKEQLYRRPFRYQDENGKWQSIPRTLEWLCNPVSFRRPQADLVRNRDYSFQDGGRTVSINTLGTRVKCTVAGNRFAKYLDGPYELGTAKLVELKGRWYLHIAVTFEVEDFKKERVAHVAGIDRGMRFLATVYDDEGKTQFVSGRKVALKRRKFQNVRQQLQKKGTKSAKRRLKAISGRENRWMSDVNHQISKTLVSKYGKDTLFVLEDLTGVSCDERNLKRSAKQKYELRSWPFFQLEQFLIYKARENRSLVLKVSPKYTSQRCPKCGAIHKGNRNHEKHLYSCSCGYKSNDDRIGAMNIQELGKRWIAGEANPHYEKLTAGE